VLRILRGAGPGGLCRREIGARMLRRVPDVTRLLDRLEEAGLVARARGGGDRRLVTARITRAGLARLGALDPVVDGLTDRLLGHLSDRRLAVLIDLLGKIRDRL
jgi:DNA-binding MarR family transcriptional regulator